MILIDGKKYACETCITGHRGSTCRHSDRPMVEIKKKGRPTTICDHCRELRKTKQVHINCICGASDSPTSSIESNKCMCRIDGICPCWTPRKGAPRSKRQKASKATLVDDGNSLANSQSLADLLSSSPDLSAEVLARIAGLRPVLPRSFNDDSQSDLDGQVGSGSRTLRKDNNHHHHHNLFFSPYNRAYDHSQTLLNDPFLGLSAPPLPTESLAERNTEPVGEALLDDLTAKDLSISSSCGCEDACHCQGCFQNHGNSDVVSPPTLLACSVPTSCVTCLDCTILAVTSHPSETLSLDQ